MDDKVYFLSKELKEEMDKDPRFIHLLELEKKINDDEEVISLSMKKETVNNKYIDLLKYYKEDDEVVVNARKELFSAKKELDSHPLVKEYLKAYSEVEQLLYELNNILFKDVKRGHC